LKKPARFKKPGRSQHLKRLARFKKPGRSQQLKKSIYDGA